MKIFFILALVLLAACSNPGLDFKYKIEKETGLIFSDEKYNDSTRLLYCELKVDDPVTDSISFGILHNVLRKEFGKDPIIKISGVDATYRWSSDKLYVILFSSMSKHNLPVYNLLVSEYPIKE